MSSHCGACNKTGVDLKTCSVCRQVKYCSVECQQEAWRKHKANCTKTATLELIHAIENGDEEAVKRLAKTKRVLNGKVDFPSQDPDGNTHVLEEWSPLHACVRKNSTDMMKILLENGANTEIKDGDGETPVFVASSSSKPPHVLKMLLKANANPNAKARDGWSCLMMAARDGYLENAKALLEAGADVFGATDMFGRNALDIVTNMRQGGAMRMRGDETWEEAQLKYEKMYELLTEHIARNYA